MNEIVRSVIRLVVGTGTSTILGNIVRSTTPQNVSHLDKVLVAIGQIAIQGLVAKVVTDYVDQQIDQILERSDKKHPEEKELEKENGNAKNTSGN